MKKLISLMLCLLLCLSAAFAMADDQLTIVHVTDMHYLSPTLTDYGESFMALIEDGDGKVTTDDAVYLLLHVMFGPEDYPLAA